MWIREIVSILTHSHDKEGEMVVRWVENGDARRVYR
jgi:hypothetical protein